MLHSFIKPGLFEPEAIVVMSEAYEAALKELHDTGQPKLVLEGHPRTNYRGGKNW